MIRHAPGFVAVVVASIILFLSGCATIDTHTPPPSDFPKLAVTEHYVSHEEMNNRCARYVSLPEACTEVDFWTMTADIWFSKDSLPSKRTIAHEWLHARGYDHVGESTFRDAWEEFKRMKQHTLPADP